MHPNRVQHIIELAREKVAQPGLYASVINPPATGTAAQSAPTLGAPGGTAAQAITATPPNPANTLGHQFPASAGAAGQKGGAQGAANAK